jgi:hypothetical protein
MSGGTTKDTNESEDWRVLCEWASKENDPKKMLELITKINQALEEFHDKPRSPLRANKHYSQVIQHPLQYDC